MQTQHNSPMEHLNVSNNNQNNNQQQLSSSRWDESIIAPFTKENPRFPKNEIRIKKRDVHPRMVRRVSSRGTNISNHCKGKRNSSMIILVHHRRSTARTSCSDITFEEYELFSDYDSDFDDDDDVDSYISEEASLIDDGDDDDEDEDYDLTPLRGPRTNTGEDDESDDSVSLDESIPRILVLALEPNNRIIKVHPSRLVTDQIRRRFNDTAAGAAAAFSSENKKNNTRNFAVDTVMLLSDSRIEDDTRDDYYILAMAAIKKHVERIQPSAVLIVTEDSETSQLCVEGYDSDNKNNQEISSQAKNIIAQLSSQSIPAERQQGTFGPDVCRQWTNRLERVGLSDATPVVFLHLPPFLPETATYHYHPSLKLETSTEGVNIAIESLISEL